MEDKPIMIWKLGRHEKVPVAKDSELYRSLANDEKGGRWKKPIPPEAVEAAGKVAKSVVSLMSLRGRRFCRPWSGIELEYLNMSDIMLETDMESLFPDIFRAVIVTEVAPGSPADRAGVLRDDVILNFCGHFLEGTMEFFEKNWDKVGESVELIVIRKGTGTLNLTMVVDEATNPLNFNRWPLV